MAERTMDHTTPLTHHSNHARENQQLQNKQKFLNRTLDPTGMFRNQGRHVVSVGRSELPQDRAQGTQRHADESFVHRGDSNSNNRLFVNNLDGDRGRGHANISIEDLSLHRVQSSGAPSKEEDYYDTETRIEPGSRNAIGDYGGFDDLTHYHHAMHGNGENTSQDHHNDAVHATNELNAQDISSVSNCTQSKDEDEQCDQDGNDSTISIMGSIINDDLDEDEGLKRVDALRWKSAMGKYGRSFVGKERMQLVSEDYNEQSHVDDADGGAKDNPYADDVFTANVGNSIEYSPDAEDDEHAREHKIANSEIQWAVLNDTLSSQPPGDDGSCHNEDNPVNISMECHVDTSHLLDESQIEEHNDFDAVHAIDENVVRVADFSTMKNSGGEPRYYNETDDDDDDEFVVKNTIPPSKGPLNNNPKHMIREDNDRINKSTTAGSRIEEESPLRAAFRRTAATAESNIRRIASPRFPTTSCTSNNNTVDATYNGSLLPLPFQLARKCFSFDDTTLDEDLEVPYQPRRTLALPKQERKSPQYYGLSAVASFPSEHEENSLKKTIPLERTSKSFSGAFGNSKSGLLPPQTPKKHPPQELSPSTFPVIRQSRTWDHQHEVNNDAGKTTPVSDTNAGRTDQQKVRRHLEEATRLLSSIVHQTLNPNASNPTEPKSLLKGVCCEKCQENGNASQPYGINCYLCADKLQQTVKSIKSLSSFYSNDCTGAEFPVSHQERLDAVDALVRCYEFTNMAAVTAHEWLESIGAKAQFSHQTMESDTSRSRLHCAELTIANKQEEIHRLKDEVSRCREEIGRLSNASRSQATSMQGITPSVDRSILSNSSEESTSLVLCSPHPVVKLSKSNEDSFARFERRMDADLKLEARKEILLLKAALEEANRKIASYENRINNHHEEYPFPSDIEPITGSDDGEPGNIFMKIADDLEHSSNPSDADDGNRLKLDDPCLEKALEEYRTALIESMNARCGIADPDMSKSCDSETADQMVNVRMLDAENFVTEWDIVPLPPPPDHGLRSPIIQTILTKWTDDTETIGALIRWVEDLLNGISPDDAPSLKISSLDHQLKEGFIYHVFPLLLRRKDIHVEVTSRATRTTSYDVAVSVSRPADGPSQLHNEKGVYESSALSHKPSRENSCHLMAFHATCSGPMNDGSKLSEKNKTLSESSLNLQQHNWKGSNAGSFSTEITSPISNRTPTKATPPLNARYMSHYLEPEGNFLNSLNTSFPDEPELPIMAGASPSLVDDLSVGSSIDGDETNNHGQGLCQNGLMNWSGAFGLLSRKKPAASMSSPHTRPASNGNNGSPLSLFLTPQRQGAPSVSSYEKDHPYHRVVSAPPGKIGLTFVEHRGHCIVSHVAQTSPLSSYVHPSDILIAIDDIPVSGLRTREIVKLLTNKKGQRRDLRMISSHDMNELIRPGSV